MNLLNESKRVPEGVSDIHSYDLELRESLVQSLKKLYRSYGYRQVQTPVFEYYDLFIEIKETIDKERMVKLIDGDGKILVLKPDATIPIARMVATNDQKEDSNYKLSYFTNIFRMNGSSQNLSNRELSQAGIEFFGRKDSEADVEVITLAIKSLQKLGLTEFQIDLGQANFFKELMNIAELTLVEQAEIRKRIEQKNVSELRQILDSIDIKESFKNAILATPMLYGNPKEVLTKAQQIALNEKMKSELRMLNEVYQKLIEDGFEEYLSIDLGMINDLNYYTGIIFQGYLKDFGKPVVIGGRYDQLTKQFGSELPATGFGFYLDDLLEIIKSTQANVQKDRYSSLIVMFEEVDRLKAIQTADWLRAQNFNVECELFDKQSVLSGKSSIVLVRDDSIDLTVEDSQTIRTFNSVNDLLLFLTK